MTTASMPYMDPASHRFNANSNTSPAASFQPPSPPAHNAASTPYRSSGPPQPAAAGGAVPGAPATANAAAPAAAGAAAASSAPAPPAAPAGAAPPAMDNIVNRRGGKEASLFQSCMMLRRRLADVPGFAPHLEDMDLAEQEAGDETDPVTSMWNMLRLGTPLLAVYNALKPDDAVQVNTSRLTQANHGKAATFKFLQACMKDLQFHSNECFLITDLYGSDTTGLVKVLKVVNRVIDILAERGLLLKHAAAADEDAAVPSGQRNHQQNVIEELVTTERDYVQHLETLQAFKLALQQGGAFSGDVLHDIFLNINALLDHQRRFLIRIEQLNSLEPSIQNWGMLFSQYQEQFREIYEPFIGNQIRCNDTVMREWERIRSVPLPPALQGMVGSHTVLTGFLLKPFQRLAKYPLLLDELRKRGNYSPEKKVDLEAGSTAMKVVLDQANVAIDNVKKQQEVVDLVSRVEDWKGHKLEHFGQLVIFGNHAVIKGDNSRESEKEYRIYLFEKILLCCKEVNNNKQKQRLASKTPDRRQKPKLQLKGRIFMQNVTDVMSYSKNGAYLLQIFWKGDPGVENFNIRFLTAEVRDKWTSLLEKQRRQLPHSSSTTRELSPTQQLSMANKTLENPYPQTPQPPTPVEESMDDQLRSLRISNGSTLVNSAEFSSRNPSSSSLRSRSTTGGSNAPGPLRMPPLRFPGMDGNGGMLKLATRMPGSGGSVTPDERVADSYFSPATESPASIRTTTPSSGVFSFPRHHLANWTTSEGKHKTAPPIGRPPENQINGQNGSGNGGINNRQGGSRPAVSAPVPPRSRSQSQPSAAPLSPGSGARRGETTEFIEEIPVPPLPPHLHGMRGSSPGGIDSSFSQSSEFGFSPPGGSPAPSSTLMSPSPAPLASPPPINGHPPSARGHPAANSQLPPLTYPSQLRIKIHFEPAPSHVTIVAAIVIKHRSLIDRIDSKMEKVTTGSIAKGTARLRYLDIEDEFITIENDDDVQMAIEEYGNKNRPRIEKGEYPDFDLYWHEIGKSAR